MTLSPPRFASTDDYGSRLGNMDFWRPYIELALRCHGLACGVVRAGEVGTFPTFVVDGHLVVKLYGDLLDGHEDHRTELACYQLIQGHAVIAAPRVVASSQGVFTSCASSHSNRPSKRTPPEPGVI